MNSMISKIRTFARGQSHTGETSAPNLPSLSQDFLPPLKYPYSRPAFLNVTDLDELSVALDKLERPILTPKDITLMPFYTGYAEVVNAGKSDYNEDQAWATVLLPPTNLSSITQHRKSYPSISVNSEHRPSISQYDSRVQEMMEMSSNVAISYFGLFDGHAGYGSALYARNNLHKIIKEKLVEIIPELKRIITEPECEDLIDDFNDKLSVEAAKQQARSKSFSKSLSSDNATVPGIQFDLQFGDNASSYALPDNTTSYNITADELIRGLLESSFTKLDQGIQRESNEVYISGGCTALVALGFNGSLYVANAGDCRALAIFHGRAIEMSRDHTPRVDRVRILSIAKQNRQLLGKEFHYLEFPKRIQRKDIGKKIACRHSTMTGWTYKTITDDDLRMPLISGEGRKGRLMSVIGVARGFGDYNLRVFDTDMYVKPFLSAEPEVRVLRASCDVSMMDQYFLAGLPPNIVLLDEELQPTQKMTKEEFVNSEMDDFLIVPPINKDEATSNERVAISTQTQSLQENSTTQTEQRRNSLISHSAFSLDDICLEESLSPEDVLVLGTDGLWDVCSTEVVQEIISKHITPDNRSDNRRYIVAAHELALYARGLFQPQSGWRTREGDIASGDDISVFVVPLIPAMYPHYCISQSQL